MGGEKYNVGDNNDNCATLACEGGVSGTCKSEDGAWSNMKVTCAHDNYRKEESEVGGHGGECTCPNGEKYNVGDNNDNCATLACEGGESGTCKAGRWGLVRYESYLCCCQVDIS